MIKQYEKYKKTGNIWFESIPSNWNVCKIKHIAKTYAGGTPSTENNDFWEGGKIPWLPSGKLQNCEITPAEKFITDEGLRNSSTKWIKPYTTLIALTGATCANIGYLTFKACANQSVVAIDEVKEKANSRFLYYILLSIKRQILTHQTGGAQAGINDGDVKNLFITQPTITEQTQISLYLDYQTDIIDNLISKKQKLIELLKEKRQAVINEAVTKGLNPNAKMKGSGIEWLGEVPEKWEIRNLETVAKKNRYSITGGPFGSDLKNEEYTEEGVRIIQLQNIGVGVFRDEYKIYTTEQKADELSSCNIYPGEIIIAKMADPVARACIIPDFDKRFIMASDGIRLEVDTEKHNVRFIEYAINAKYFNFQAELNSTGSTRLRIGLTTIKKLKLLLPKLIEQNNIIEFLEIYNNSFSEATNKLFEQIEKLKEYRQSIISEAVTGKIDVRDWQAPKN